MPIHLDTFALDRGIERIIRSDPHQAALPDTAGLLPSESASSPELDKLLALPNLQDFLTSYFRPAITDKSMLTPQGFQLALQQSMETLRGQLRAGGSTSTDSTQPVQRALRLLGQESDLRDLVTMYRSALYQG